ncbi:DUF1345 domain-containing protein [Kocuria rhizophila]|uniref:DUF1345 domain-containing protein n=1 Tax=Kocuria rhizophila TaxID=72000 RepID=UPI001EF66DA5|nr:DUF1345 domain-containing protein [Kocuria rhizophila]MCG7424050.1 DUF1345 domain-containing protein [Kocuria rhizophila]
MSTHLSKRNLLTSAPFRLGGSIAMGVLALLVAVNFLGMSLSLLVGMCTISLLYVVVSAGVLWPMDPERTRYNAGREDFHPVIQEVMGVTLAVASLVTVISLLVAGSHQSRTLAAGLGLVTIFLAWGVLHLLYGTRYAHEYFRDPKGGIDFNNEDAPRYVDFLYLAFTLGMTFAVSDTNLSHTGLRAIALRHCLLSYVFSTVILAATVNLVMGVLPG